MNGATAARTGTRPGTAQLLLGLGHGRARRNCCSDWDTAGHGATAAGVVGLGTATLLLEWSGWARRNCCRSGTGLGGQVACAGMGALSEFDSKQLLAGHGVVVSRDKLARTANDAVAAAADIGGPVAVKLCGSSLLHKSERGLVRLGLDGPDAVRAAAEGLLAAANEDDGDVALLVSEMVVGHRELIAGVVRTEQFGPVLMLGLGGVLAEAVGEAVFRLLPTSRADCQEMIEDMGLDALLGPLRGEPAVDRTALIAALMGLAQSASTDGIEAIDVNPLVIRDGQPVAVDALVVMSGS